MCIRDRAYSLSGYNAVLSGDVTFYPIEFTLDAYKQILGRAQILSLIHI